MNQASFYQNALIFLTLLLLSEGSRLFFKEKRLPTSIGSIIMAIGIFTLAALPKLPFPTAFISHVITLELLIIWLYLASFFILLALEGHFLTHLQVINNQLGIGTWIAGSAVLGILFLKEFPLWQPVIWVLTPPALGLWLAYLWFILLGLKTIILSTKVHTGNLFLTTVSTQSIALLLYSLVHHSIPSYVYEGLINLGILFYFISLIVLLIDFISMRLKHLILRWSNNNSIIHGALSITGLASLYTLSHGRRFVVFVWVMASCLFILVEGISLIRLFYRIYLAGFMKGACKYDVSQWSRNFTYGMYYAFTLAVSSNLLISNVVINAIINYGQYVVLGILLWELFIFFRNRMMY